MKHCIMGWVKIHRKFLEWEWYDDSKMVKLFLHLLLTANHEEKKWHGRIIGRGQLVTGLYSLSEEANLSIQSLRTCLDKLQKTGEINKQTNTRFTVITICNYDDYQSYDNPINTPPNKQTTNKQQTNNNKQEYKEYKEEEYIMGTEPAKPDSDNGLFDKGVEGEKTPSPAPAPELSPKKKELNENARKVIEYLNRKAGKNFRTDIEGNLRPVRARIKEGYTSQQFKDVIDRKCLEWANDDKYHKFLRPNTLFSSEKFDAYLNEKKGVPTAERYGG